MSTPNSLNGWARWNSTFKRLLGPSAALCAVILFFSLVAPESFCTIQNARTLSAQSVVVVLGAIGMTFVVVGGGIDLSIGSVIALSSVASALMVRAGFSSGTAALLGCFVGLMVGCVNGFLVASARLPAFIATLGTMGIARGVAKWLANQSTIYPPEDWTSSLMAKNPDPAWLLLAPGVWITIVIALAFGFVLSRTVFGAWVTSIGSNESAARLCGVPVVRVRWTTYALCGLLAGVAGVLQFHRLSGGDPTTANGKELEVIAAVVIGGAALSGGFGTVGGSIVGAILMAALANGCNLVDWNSLGRWGVSTEMAQTLSSWFGSSGIPNYVQEILVGVVIVIAALADRRRHR